MDNHAEQNAKAWLDSIMEMIAALEAFDDNDSSFCDPDNLCGPCLNDIGRCAEWPTVEGQVMETKDDVQNLITESPLSVQVRGGWYTPGDYAPEPEEFEILLSTGGPALRIVGDLDDSMQPVRPRLQYQDWGTPWTEYIVAYDDPMHDAKRDALQRFCEQFYFGG